MKAIRCFRSGVLYTHMSPARIGRQQWGLLDTVKTGGHSPRSSRACRTDEAGQCLSPQCATLIDSDRGGGRKVLAAKLTTYHLHSPHRLVEAFQGRFLLPLMLAFAYSG